MPYHSSPKNSKTRKPSKMKINMIEKSGLHAAQKRAMKKHAVHHTTKHLKMMTDLMINKKMTFRESHMETSKKIGK